MLISTNDNYRAKPSRSLGIQVFSNNLLFLCKLKLFNSSLLFMMKISGWKIKQYFSRVHKLHLPVIGVNGAAWSSFFHLRLYSMSFSFKFQMKLVSVVEFLCFPLLKEVSWFESLALNFFAVNPTQVCVYGSAWFVTIVA